MGLEQDVNLTSDLGFSKITGQSEFPYRWEEIRREEEMSHIPQTRVGDAVVQAGRPYIEDPRQAREDTGGASVGNIKEVKSAGLGVWLNFMGGSLSVRVMEVPVPPKWSPSVFSSWFAYL